MCAYCQREIETLQVEPACREAALEEKFRHEADERERPI